MTLPFDDVTVKTIDLQNEINLKAMMLKNFLQDIKWIKVPQHQSLIYCNIKNSPLTQILKQDFFKSMCGLNVNNFAW